MRKNYMRKLRNRNEIATLFADFPPIRFVLGSMLSDNKYADVTEQRDGDLSGWGWGGEGHFGAGWDSLDSRDSWMNERGVNRPRILHEYTNVVLPTPAMSGGAEIFPVGDGWVGAFNG